MIAARRPLKAWAVVGFAGLALSVGAFGTDSGPRRRQGGRPRGGRARDEVQKLDALYKTAVVSVTNQFEGPPAIKMAMDVFAAMEKGDGTGS